MSSNLYKANWVVCHEDGPRVIDSNELIAQKIETLAAQMEQEAQGKEEPGYADDFSDGIEAPAVDALLAEDSEATVIHAKAAVEQEEKEAQLARERQQLEEEKEQIEQMKQSALTEVEELKRQAIEEGRQAGYEDGHKQGLQEADQMKQVCAMEKAQLKQEYENQIRELEPVFIDHLTAIYEHVLGIELSGYRRVTEYLLTETLQNIEGTRDFLIHVSHQEYPEISADKEEIMKQSATTQYHVEIIEDISLQPGECMIETPGGIFDCSLGTQLSELTKKLKVLSFEK